MKEKSVLILVLIISVVEANAQLLVPKICYTLSKTTDSFLYPTGYRKIKFVQGYSVGFGAEIPLTKSFAIQADLLYTTKGQEEERAYIEPGQGYYKEADKYVLNYIELPILLRKHLYKSNFNFFFEAGFSVAYGINGKRSLYTEYYSASQNFRFINTTKGNIYFDDPKTPWVAQDAYLDNQFDVSVQLGSGIVVAKKIIVNVKYSRGLVSLQDDKNCKNRVFEVGAGIPLRIVSMDTASLRHKRKIPVYLSIGVGKSNTTLKGSQVDFHLEDNPPGQNVYIEPLESTSIFLQAKIELANCFFLKPGLAYLQKGGEEINGRFTYDLKAHINYLSIPVLVGFQPINFSNTRNLSISVEGGITSNIELSSDKENLTKGLFPGTPVTMNESILSYQIGANVEIKITDRFVLFGNYTKFKDMDNFFERTFGGITYDIRSEGFTVSGGLMIKLGSED